MATPKPMPLKKPSIRKNQVKNPKPVVEPTDFGDQKVFVWVCTGNNKMKTVKAPSLLEAGPECMRIYGYWPESIEKKVFERQEHLTQRLSSNDDLRNLRKRLLKEAGK